MEHQFHGCTDCAERLDLIADYYEALARTYREALYRGADCGDHEDWHESLIRVLEEFASRKPELPSFR